MSQGIYNPFFQNGAYWYGQSGGSDLFPKKSYLLVLVMPAQSNEGGVDNTGTQETGSVPFSDLPSHLSTAPTNVFYIQKSGGGTLALAPWTVPVGLEWGWYNQFAYVISGSWNEIIIGKESLGGSDILTGGGGLYPRADAKAVANASISAANTRWGAGNYNVVYICGIGETNALSAANADNWFPAMQEFVDNDLRVNYVNAPIIVIKKGRWQVIDFPYIVSNLWAAQDAYIATNTGMNFIVTGEIPNGGGGWELQDLSANDFSHYNATGAMTMGNAVADKALYLFGATKSNTTKPAIVSAVVENAAPSNIVITFSKPLNNILPFWKAYAISPGRNVVSSSISGSTLTLTVSHPFYQGQSITLSYTKKQYFENAICDLLGNELDNFTSLAVTNNVSTAVPTYTNVYTSNFSAGVDSWGGSSGGVVTRLASWAGENDVLEVSGTDTTPLVFRSSVFVAGQSYRVRFKCYIPTLLVSGGGIISDAYDVSVKALSQAISGNIYQYSRRSLLGDQWIDYEFTFTSTQTQLRIESTMAIGEKIYFKGFVVDRIN